MKTPTPVTVVENAPAEPDYSALNEALKAELRQANAQLQHVQDLMTIANRRLQRVQDDNVELELRVLSLQRNATPTAN